MRREMMKVMCMSALLGGAMAQFGECVCGVWRAAPPLAAVALLEAPLAVAHPRAPTVTLSLPVPLPGRCCTHRPRSRVLSPPCALGPSPVICRVIG